MKSVFWFRRDLRLHDNHGLFKALSESKNVVPIFIFDKNILDKLKNKKDKRVDFIHRSLESLQKQLTDNGSSLFVYYNTPLEAFKEIIKEHKPDRVYTNRDYESYATDRDVQVQNFLSDHKIEFKTFKDQCIFEKLEVTKQDGKPYSVYTPYMRTWKKQLKSNHLKSYPSHEHLDRFIVTSARKFPSLKDMGFEKTDLTIPPTNWPLENLKKYDKNRNTPSLTWGTSHYGIHLRFGTLSIRELMTLAKKWNETWMNELIWRDFYMQILANFPHVEKGSFRKAYDNIQWSENQTHFKAWCEGKTGFPIVDAGMRELNHTGYMHNRVRMITASFLCKNLQINWMWGERYFAEKLLDYELASNNGNWQWAAGSGCDAAPYFRIFNPETQIKKFDPNYEYIKTWVPEFGTEHYPEPIIDYKQSREDALNMYKAALK